MTSVGSMVGGAFGVVLRHPLAVLVWGLIYVAMFLAFAALMWPMFEAIMSLPIGGSEQELARELNRVQFNSGLTTLAQVGSYIVPALCSTAAIRTVLRPEQGGFFYLRIGMDEVRVGVCWFILGMAAGIGLVVAMIPAAIVAGITYAAGGEAAMIPVVILLALFLACVYLYLFVRLSLMAPLSFIRQEFAFSEGWKLTKGKFWTLFGGYFVVGLVATAVSLVGLVAVGWPLLEELGRANFAPGHIAEAFSAYVARASRFDIQILLGWIVLGLANGINIALYSGAAASAARDLAWDPHGTGQAFA